MALQRQWEYERSVWLERHPVPWSADVEADYRARFTERMESWLDAGMGSCCLRLPELRSFVTSAITCFDGQRHDLDALVIMPNHVHLILKPHSGQDIFKLLGGMKSASARRIHDTTGETGRALWMEDSYNRVIRDSEELSAYRAYISGNPKIARLKDSKFTLIENHVLDPFI